MDLRTTGDHDCVDKNKALEVMEKIGAVALVECSAKTGEGLSDVFVVAVRSEIIAKQESGSSSLKLVDEQNTQGKSMCVLN